MDNCYLHPFNSVELWQSKEKQCLLRTGSRMLIYHLIFQHVFLLDEWSFFTPEWTDSIYTYCVWGSKKVRMISVCFSSELCPVFFDFQSVLIKILHFFPIIKKNTPLYSNLHFFKFCHSYLNSWCASILYGMHLSTDIFFFAKTYKIYCRFQRYVPIL